MTILKAALDNKLWFRTSCRQNNLKITDEQLERLEIYAALLLYWNRRINLISRKDERNFWTSHLLHSASILFKLHLPEDASILDLGTGGGLPGIPLKILLPDIKLTLVDSTQKKIKVVQMIIDTLSLKNAVALWARAEEIGKQAAHHKRYDIVVARAVSSLRNLVCWSWPLVKDRGALVVRGGNQQHAGNRRVVVPPALIALKGGNLESEIESVRRNQHVRSIAVVDLTLKGSTQIDHGDKKIVAVNF